MKTLTGIKAAKHILDPVHGPIPLTSLELEIISEPIFQRLRYVSQLSLASLVYPGATHNRFQHSIGTLHIMDKLLNSLNVENKIHNDNETVKKIIQKMRIVSLLHDCGHLPFSHTLEGVNEVPDHEKIGEIIVTKSKLAEILEKSGINSRSIGALIRGKVNVEDPHAATITKLIPLIHSDADADRMDYLLRDAYFTGVPYGNVDVDRICNFVDIIGEKFCFSNKAQNALEDFLFSRYQMYKIVYIHKTVIFYNLLLQKIYRDYLNPYHDSVPFKIPSYNYLENADKALLNKIFLNLTEASFFQSINLLLKSDELISKERANLVNLMKCITHRKPVYNCFKIDDISEQNKTEYCDAEKELFLDLQDNNPDIVNHWSFLRHDPSKPIRIASPISGDIDDVQDPEQIRICPKNEGDELILFQTKSNTYINSLSQHHRVLICYYHAEPSAQKTIKQKAKTYLNM